MNKYQLSESDIKAKYITPAVIASGWDENTQLRREVYFTDGRIYLLAHSSSQATKIYTHPNLELAKNWINKLPNYS